MVNNHVKNTYTNRAVIFDRDGVLNKSIIIDNKPFSPKNLDEVDLNYEMLDVINFTKSNNIYNFCFTNQPDVSRGNAKKEDILNINKYILKKFLLDEICCCFHDNNENCSYRKPKPGSLFYLQDKYNLDLEQSLVIGDRKKDIDAAFNANTKSLFIDYNYDEEKPIHQIATVSCLKDILNNVIKIYE